MNEQAPGVVLRICPEVDDRELNALFKASWRGHQPREFGSVLERSLAYVCAYRGSDLIGFVNLAWDGGVHAFILDTTVHPRFQRVGIGRRLVQAAITVAESAEIAWVHVDYEPRLRPFYASCGFTSTEAGLLHLGTDR